MTGSDPESGEAIIVGSTAVSQWSHVSAGSVHNPNRVTYKYHRSMT